MVSHQEIQIRQLIWSDFRAGKTKQEALNNARSTFGAEFVSAEMIDMWFAHFKAGKPSILDNASVHAIQTLPTGEEVRALIFKHKTLNLERHRSIFRVCFKRLCFARQDAYSRWSSCCFSRSLFE
jgi:hypothetical protein